MAEPRTERELLIEAKEVIENDSIYIAELKEEVARHRPWLFVPGDKVLVLLDETIYSGVVQQIQMPSPMGEAFPEYVVRVKLDEGTEFAGTTPWCHPDQVERI